MSRLTDRVINSIERYILEPLKLQIMEKRDGKVDPRGEIINYYNDTTFKRVLYAVNSLKDTRPNFTESQQLKNTYTECRKAIYKAGFNNKSVKVDSSFKRLAIKEWEKFYTHNLISINSLIYISYSMSDIRDMFFAFRTLTDIEYSDFAFETESLYILGFAPAKTIDMIKYVLVQELEDDKIDPYVLSAKGGKQIVDDRDDWQKLGYKNQGVNVNDYMRYFTIYKGKVYRFYSIANAGRWWKVTDERLKDSSYSVITTKIRESISTGEELRLKVGEKEYITLDMIWYDSERVGNDTD